MNEKDAKARLFVTTWPHPLGKAGFQGAYAVPVWTCSHNHRSVNAAMKCAQDRLFSPDSTSPEEAHRG